MPLDRTHRLLGAAALAMFIFTGVYMRVTFPELYGGDEGVRVLYRANHIYLLMSSLLNLAMGAYFVARPPGWRRRLQVAGSALILLAPFVLAPAFFIDPPRGPAGFRTLSHIGVFALVLGVLAQVAARPRRARDPV